MDSMDKYSTGVIGPARVRVLWWAIHTVVLFPIFLDLKSINQNVLETISSDQGGRFSLTDADSIETRGESVNWT